MGVVYEAEHLLIGRKVAVKTLTPRSALSSACVARFRREAQAAASVGNSHVVDVLDMGELEDGSLYIVLEHLNGVHLGWAVAEAGRFSLNRAIFVMCQLCDALAAVHDAGIVHRDLKPENIFLIERDGAQDFVKLLDFGVCKLKDASGERLTDTGDMVGTPLFMSPEQVENERNIDQRTDVYALGAILYLLLTGQVPFDASTLPKLFIRICTEAPPSLRSVDDAFPDELDAIVQRALRKSPELRFESCRQLKQALLHFLQSAAPASGMRWRDELAATLPVNAADIYASEVDPKTTQLGVQPLPLEPVPMSRVSPATIALLALLPAAALGALWPSHPGPAPEAVAQSRPSKVASEPPPSLEPPMAALQKADLVPLLAEGRSSLAWPASSSRQTSEVVPAGTSTAPVEDLPEPPPPRVEAPLPSASASAEPASIPNPSSTPDVNLTHGIKPHL